MIKKLTGNPIGNLLMVSHNAAVTGLGEMAVFLRFLQKGRQLTQIPVHNLVITVAENTL